MNGYDYFQNTQCPWFPCHAGADRENFSCLFCYCPLYCLGSRCGGSFRYTDDGIKDCSATASSLRHTAPYAGGWMPCWSLPEKPENKP